MKGTTTQRGRTKNTRRIRLCSVVVRRNTTTQHSRRNKGREQGTEKLTKAERETKGGGRVSGQRAAVEDGAGAPVNPSTVRWLKTAQALANSLVTKLEAR